MSLSARSKSKMQQLEVTRLNGTCGLTNQFHKQSTSNAGKMTHWQTLTCGSANQAFLDILEKTTSILLPSQHSKDDFKDCLTHSPMSLRAFHLSTQQFHGIFHIHNKLDWKFSVSGFLQWPQVYDISAVCSRQTAPELETKKDILHCKEVFFASKSGTPQSLPSPIRSIWWNVAYQRSNRPVR